MSQVTAIRHIVLAYDGSDEADHAFEYARAIARKFDAKLEVLSIVSVPAISDIVETKAALEEGTERAARGQRRLRHLTKDETIPVRFMTKVGRPTQQIVAQAEELGADLIVMGHRRRSLMERGFTRSTAIRVMEAASCPILIVP